MLDSLKYAGEASHPAISSAVEIRFTGSRHDEKSVISSSGGESVEVVMRGKQYLISSHLGVFI